MSVCVRTSDFGYSQTFDRLPKVCGADVELGNFVLGMDRQGGTSREASRALLREIDGVPGPSGSRYGSGYGYSYGARAGEDRSSPYSSYGTSGTYGYDPQDWGRKYLPTNGGCVYIDLQHLEICLPEVRGAHDFVAAWHAMLRISREAMEAANARMPEGCRIEVLVNNSDGLGSSYGSHTNFLIARRAWDNIFGRKLHHLLYLAAYQVSSIVFTGQGKVGAENGAPEVPYQISQRADFFETLTGVQTTSNRPIVNSRDESLCEGARGGLSGGGSDSMARLHCIFYDSNLCHVANLLKVGVMQVVLAMIEAERFDPALILDDPVGAVIAFSHDPTLQARARTTSGDLLTAVELQTRFLEHAKDFADSGGCDGIVPRAEEIIALWEDTLAKLRDRKMDELAPRLDWVLKGSMIRETMQRRPGLEWDSPQVKQLDHLYSNLNPTQGLYWAYEEAGLVQRVATDLEIQRLQHEPPEDTRAWTRAMLLRRAEPGSVDWVDWDYVRFRQRGRGFWSSSLIVDMPDPLGLTKAQAKRHFGRRASFDDIANALGAHEPKKGGYHSANT